MFVCHAASCGFAVQKQLNAEWFEVLLGMETLWDPRKIVFIRLLHEVAEHTYSDNTNEVSEQRFNVPLDTL